MTKRLPKAAISRDRLFDRLVVEPGGCVVWTGSTTRGHGRMTVNGKQVYTHRMMYELFAGPIPAGMDIDHLCRNPACANVDHLEAVPHAVNVQRGLAGELRTHCPHGHELDGRVSRGERYCLTCNRERGRRNRESIR